MNGNMLNQIIGINNDRQTYEVLYFTPSLLDGNFSVWF